MTREHKDALLLGGFLGGGAIVAVGVSCLIPVLTLGAAIGCAFGSVFGYFAGLCSFHRWFSTEKKCAGDLSLLAGMLLGTAVGGIGLPYLITRAHQHGHAAPKQTAWNISVHDDFNTRAMKSGKTLVLDAKAFTAPKRAA